MTSLFVSVDRSRVREGKMGVAKAAFRELVAFVEANEPRVLSYAVHEHPDGPFLTVVQVHPDSASMERHMDVAAAAFARFRDLLEIEAIDLYGDARDALLDRMRAKAKLLGSAAVRVHPLAEGFAARGL